MLFLTRTNFNRLVEPGETIWKSAIFLNFKFSIRYLELYYQEIKRYSKNLVEKRTVSIELSFDKTVYSILKSHRIQIERYDNPIFDP